MNAINDRYAREKDIRVLKEQLSKAEVKVAALESRDEETVVLKVEIATLKAKLEEHIERLQVAQTTINDQNDQLDEATSQLNAQMSTMEIGSRRKRVRLTMHDT